MTSKTLLVLACSLLLARDAFAVAPDQAARVQPGMAVGSTAEPPKWEIEIYTGGTTGGDPVPGSGTLPPPRPPVVFTSPFFPPVIVPNFPSWYFGAGAQYLNDGLLFLRARIAPLDAVLTEATVARQAAGNVGVRVSRRITGRLRAEVTVDYGLGRLGVTGAARDQIEASRAGFAAVFGQLPPFIIGSITSTSSGRDRAGRELATTAALAVDLRARGRAIPFALIGAGITSHLGETPHVMLSGGYHAGGRLPPPPGSGLPASAVVQSDNVAISYSVPDRTFLTIVGGGLRYALSRRLVARVDAKAHVVRDRLTVSVDATPTTGSTVPGTQQGVSFGILGGISLNFSSNPSGMNSLSGPAVTDFVTFTGRGMQTRMSLAAGLGWRF